MKDQNPTLDSLNYLKKYINLRTDAILLAISQKLSNGIAYFIFALIMAFVFIFVSLFLSLSLAEWLADLLNRPGIGNLIVSGIYVILGVFVYVFRTKLILNPISKNMGKIMDMSDLNNESAIHDHESIEEAIINIHQKIKGAEEDIHQNIDDIKEYYSFEQLRDRFIRSISTNPRNIINVLLILREVLKSRKKNCD